jgi:hypothetical protein
MSRLTVTCFSNDKGEVFDRAYYRLGREYGYVFKDVVVELTVKDGEVKCGIYELDKSVLADCSQVIIERLVANLDEWLAEAGDFYDLEQGEDRWPVYGENNGGLLKAVEDVIIEAANPAEAARIITNIWL